MEQAKAARKESKRKFTRTVNILTEILVQQSTLKTLERRMEDLKLKWNDAQEKHEKYITTLGEGINEEEEDKWIEEIDGRYYERESYLDKAMEEKLMELKEGRLEEKRTIIEAQPRPKSSIKIEHLKFKSFDGDLRNFPRFKEEFNNHIKPMCSETQLPLVLKSYLVETVREDVENIGDNMADLWERLDKKYGDQGRLIDTILAEVKGIPSCKNDDQATLNMVKVVERAHCDLKRMGKEAEMDNTTIISMLEEKMSDEMANEWIKLVTKDENKYRNKFELLNKLLLEFRDRIEYKLANIRKVDEKKYVSYHINPQTSQTSLTKKSKCWLHKINGDHPIWRCRLFLNKPVLERIELVKQNNACYSCLELGHTASACVRGFVCTEVGCQQTHNRLLHVNRMEQQDIRDSNNSYKNTMLPIQ